MRFDHIGIVTPTLAQGRAFFSSVLQVTQWTEEYTDPGIGVLVQFGRARDGAGPCYELIAPHGACSPIARAAKSHTNILNHVAYVVDDLAESAALLHGSGCMPVSQAQPAVAYGGRKVQFFLSPLVFIIELVEGPAPQPHLTYNLEPHYATN